MRIVKRAQQAWQQHHTPSPNGSKPQAATAAAPQAAKAAGAPEQTPPDTPARQASQPARLDQVYLDQAPSAEQTPPTEIAPAPPTGTEAQEASAPPDAVQRPEPPPRPAPSPPPQQAYPAGSQSSEHAEAAAATLSNTRDASVGSRLPPEVVASEPTAQPDAGETEAAWVHCNHRADVQRQCCYIVLCCPQHFVNPMQQEMPPPLLQQNRQQSHRSSRGSSGQCATSRIAAHLGGGSTRNKWCLQTQPCN